MNNGSDIVMRKPNREEINDLRQAAVSTVEATGLPIRGYLHGSHGTACTRKDGDIDLAGFKCERFEAMEPKKILGTLNLAPKKIALAGIGYVGSNAILLAQHNEVFALDIVPEKIAMLNRKQSPIEDPEVEDYLAHKKLNFRATLDKVDAYNTQLLPATLRSRLKTYSRNDRRFGSGLSGLG